MTIETDPLQSPLSQSSLAQRAFSDLAAIKLTILTSMVPVIASLICAWQVINKIVLTVEVGPILILGKGVTKCGDKWRTLIGINYVSVHIGLFRDKREAGLFYDAAAKIAYGDFVNLNFSAAESDHVKLSNKILAKNQIALKR